MALIHPRSLARWNEWQSSRNRVRRLKHSLTNVLHRRRHDSDACFGFVLHSREGTSGHRVLIGIDSASPTSRSSLLGILPHMSVGVDVLAPAAVRLPELDGPEWSQQRVAAPQDLLRGRGIGVVITLGWHLDVGHTVHEWAQAEGVASTVVQHGALTPFAPPLPPDSTFLAWNGADAEFYRSERHDIETHVVGSNLLWQAADESCGALEVLDDRPTFLGQMHGAELPRWTTAATALSFCRSQNSLYRPHPAETDAVSRAAHVLMKRSAVEFDESMAPLRDLRSPVVGIFSTGVLEAAARGLPSWVYGPRTPTWVHDFWDRYDMNVWGGEPTPAPKQPEDDPARLVAHLLEGAR